MIFWKSQNIVFIFQATVLKRFKIKWWLQRAQPFLAKLNKHKDLTQKLKIWNFLIFIVFQLYLHARSTKREVVVLIVTAI